MNNRVIVWRIIQDCNSNCRFCSYARDVKRKRDTADKKQIINFIEVCGEYIKKSGRNVLISWMGGEPFLYPDIMELSKECHQRHIDVSTTTNGMALKKEDMPGICEYFSEIVFSIDSFEECNDYVRGVKGHFKTVTNKIKELDGLRREMGSPLKIKVNTILMRRNIDDFEAFCLYLKGIGVDEVTFNRLGGFDRPEFYGENSLLLEQSEAFAANFKDIQGRLMQKGLVVHGSDKYMDRFITAAKNVKNPIDECNPGDWFWFVNENGYISPCSYTTYEYKIAISEIDSPEKIDKVSEDFRKFRKEARSKWCADCFCTQVYDKFE